MRGRALIVALIVSGVLNLFLISAGAAAYWQARHAAATGAAAPLGLRRGAASLNPEDRKAFIAMLRMEGKLVKPDNRHARALRDGAWSALADGSAPAAAIKQDLATAASLNQASRRTVEDATVDFALTLSPAERRALGGSLRPPPLPKRKKP